MKFILIIASLCILSINARRISVSMRTMDGGYGGSYGMPSRQDDQEEEKPAYQAPASFPGGPFPFAGGWTSTNTQKSNALYFQDQLAWGNWRLLAGIRNERVNSFDTFSFEIANLKIR